jgi:hypothetical protein
VLNAALCISTAQMYSHYPVQVDLGALAFLVLAVHFALAGPAWAASAAAVAAVASREFGIAAVLFVLHREVRLGRPLRGALVCAPALAVFIALRVAASDVPGGGMITPTDLLGNLRLWGDPMFAAFVTYFVCTVFGGLGAWLLAQPRRLVVAVRAEPELATFLVPIVLVSAFTPDIWRYLAFLLPGVAVLFARLTRDQRHRVLVGSGITAFTLFTQEPFRRITDNIYFGEWFPYYDWFPVEGPPPGMADWWLRRLALTAGALGLLVALARLTRRRQPVAGTLAV